MDEPNEDEAMEDYQRAVVALGGPTAFYQNARAKFDLSEYITKAKQPDTMTRLRWLKDAIDVLEDQIGISIHRGKVWNALQYRFLAASLMDEMGKLLEVAKAAKAEASSTKEG